MVRFQVTPNPTNLKKGWAETDFKPNSTEVVPLVLLFQNYVGPTLKQDFHFNLWAQTEPENAHTGH